MEKPFMNAISVSSEDSTSCLHVFELVPPRPDQVVHREECTQCFDNQDGPNGVDVCLTCFNGACRDGKEKLHNHSSLHFEKTFHPVVLNVKRTPKLREEEPPKKLTKLEIVAEEPESERYDFITTVYCWACNVQISPMVGDLPGIIPAVLSAQTSSRRSDIQAFSFELRSCEHALLLQQDANTLTLEESSHRLSHCNLCDLRGNLWLCLQCGNVGCGRKQYGDQGLPGNGHALVHYNDTSHPVAVKLGSITADGKADVYCYKDDEDIVDPDLGRHLENWGIRLADVIVTEKSLAEMQLDLQYKYSFNMSTSAGDPLEPVFGPGLTGLQNLGNSCYVSGIIQALFSIPEWEKRYNTAFEIHPRECDVTYNGEGKGACLECQMGKVCNGLTSGRYSVKQNTLLLDEGKEESQTGICPRMFKALIGAGHAEFAGMKQQDAQEFFIWLLSRIQRYGKAAGNVEKALIAAEREAMLDDGWGGYVNPTKVFKFACQQRTQCLACGGVKYKLEEMDNIQIHIPNRLKQHDIPLEEGAAPEYEPIDFEDCIKTYSAKGEIDLTCSRCGHKRATLAHGFLSLPDVLVVTASRFVLQNWVPTKYDVPLIVPQEPISFDKYLVKRGLQLGEDPLPVEDTPSSSIASSLPPVNEATSLQLQDMGFSPNQAEKALRMTGNGSADIAMQWLFDHMNDPDIELPYTALSSSSPVNEESLANLMGMGFDDGIARRALQETGGDMERAVEWLFSHPNETAFGPSAAAEQGSAPLSDLDAFDPKANAVPLPADAKIAGHTSSPARYQLQSVVMHKGSSLHAGHYVAFIRKEIPGVGEDWVLFNDEKVVRGGDWNEVYKTGYVYIFRRIR